MCHCCHCCHAKCQGKLHEDHEGHEDPADHEGHERLQGRHPEDPGQEAHAYHEERGQGIQACPQVEAQVCGVQLGHQVLQGQMSIMGLDPTHHGDGEVQGVFHTMVEELPQEWCALAPVGSKTESHG